MNSIAQSLAASASSASRLAILQRNQFLDECFNRLGFTVSLLNHFYIIADFNLSFIEIPESLVDVLISLSFQDPKSLLALTERQKFQDRGAPKNKRQNTTNESEMDGFGLTC